MKNKKPIVIYLNDAGTKAVLEFAKKTNRTKTAAGELLVQAGLIAIQRPIEALLGNIL